MPDPPTQPCSVEDYVKDINSGSEAGLAIHGHMISLHHVISTMQCSDLCLRQPRCKAYNLEILPSFEGMRLCELMEDHETKIRRENFKYWLFDRALYTKVETCIGYLIKTI